MGLLFIREGDESAVGEKIELSIKEHFKLLSMARTAAGAPMPLVRRLNNYYADVLFECDELPALVQELRQIHRAWPDDCVEALMRLCAVAMADSKGLETLAD